MARWVMIVKKSISRKTYQHKAIDKMKRRKKVLWFHSNGWLFMKMQFCLTAAKMRPTSSRVLAIQQRRARAQAAKSFHLWNRSTTKFVGSTTKRIWTERSQTTTTMKQPLKSACSKRNKTHWVGHKSPTLTVPPHRTFHKTATHQVRRNTILKNTLKSRFTKTQCSKTIIIQ